MQNLNSNIHSVAASYLSVYLYIFRFSIAPSDIMTSRIGQILQHFSDGNMLAGVSSSALHLVLRL
jgi:hypothetical protein